MVSKYILHYFQVADRGEFIRLIFKHANVDYSEETLSLSQDIPKLKENGTVYKCTMVYICFQMRNYKLVIINSQTYLRYQTVFESTEPLLPFFLISIFFRL